MLITKAAECRVFVIQIHSLYITSKSTFCELYEHMLFGMWIISHRMGIISTSSPKSFRLSFGMDTIAVQCDGWAEWVSSCLFIFREETNAFLTKHEIDMSNCPTMTGSESLGTAFRVHLSSTWIFFMRKSNLKSGDALEIHQSEQSIGESRVLLCVM